MTGHVLIWLDLVDLADWPCLAKTSYGMAEPDWTWLNLVGPGLSIGSLDVAATS